MGLSHQPPCCLWECAWLCTAGGADRRIWGQRTHTFPCTPGAWRAGRLMAFIWGDAPHLLLAHALPAEEVQSGGTTHLLVLPPPFPLPTQPFPLSPTWPHQQAQAWQKHVHGSVLILVDAVRPGIAHLWTPNSNTLIHHSSLREWQQPLTAVQ